MLRCVYHATLFHTLPPLDGIHRRRSCCRKSSYIPTHSSFESPGSIRASHRSHSAFRRAPDGCSSRSIVGIEACAIYGEYLPRRTTACFNHRGSFSPHRCLPHKDFAAGVALSSNRTEKEKGEKSLFLGDEKRSYRDSTNHIGPSNGCIAIAHVPDTGIFLRERRILLFPSVLCTSGVSLYTMYIISTYTLLGQGNITTSYECRAAKF